jgi:hypothetical protein
VWIYWSLSPSCILLFRLSRPLKSFDSWANFYTVRNMFQVFIDIRISICKTYDNISKGKSFMRITYQLLEFIKRGPLYIKRHTWSKVHGALSPQTVRCKILQISTWQNWPTRIRDTFFGLRFCCPAVVLHHTDSSEDPFPLPDCRI